MAKDDYYTIVAKILVYLYSRLKGKTNKSPEEFLVPMSKEFPIAPEYFQKVLSEMQKHNYIELYIQRAYGGIICRMDIENIEITQEGIDFLIDNSKVRKALELIPMAASIYELFQ